MFLFIFGKDPEISKVELSSYLTKSQIQFSVKLLEEKYCILDIPDELNFNPTQSIQDLGGTVRIGKLLSFSNYFEDSFVDRIENYSSKFSYSISSINISDYEHSLFEDILKNKFKKDKIKAIYKSNHPKNKNLNLIDPQNYYSWGLNSGFELIILKNDETYYYFETLSCTNPKIFEERDLERPNRFITHATSPRLASMLINTLGAEKNSILVDPYCGTGTLLIEAILKNHKVIGIDNDLNLIQSSRENIEWAKNRYSLENVSYNLIYSASEIAKFSANVCCFEPYMGPFLRKAPSQSEAFEVVNELTTLYSGLFENLAKNLKPKNSVFDVVCILPFFETKDGRTIGISNEVFEDHGFSLVELTSEVNLISENPVSYKASSGNFIGRKVYFLKLR